MADRFPQFATRDLEGKDVQVPGELTGDPNLVIVAFQPEHQQVIESWMPSIQKLEADNPTMESWVVTLVPRKYKWVYGTIVSRIKGGITDPKLRRHTLTACLELKPPQSKSGLPSAEQIGPYVLDRSGSIQAYEAGSFTEEKLGRIAAAVQAIKQAGAEGGAAN
jgi:hypothetical protein